MRQVDEALAAAIAAPERTTRIRLSVDFDSDGHGGRGTIDDLSATTSSVRAGAVLQTTVPEQVAVVEGTAAATLSADLAGDSADERLDAVRYFAPTSTSSPLAGKQRLGRDVECDVEFLTATGWQAVPLLRGVSRAMPASVARRIARLDAIDYRARLRTEVQLPAMAADVDGPNNSPCRPNLEGTWVASFVLWSCGVPLSPPPPDGCRVWAPMHGSAMPFIAAPYTGSPVSSMLTGGEGTRIQFDDGPFLLASRQLPGFTGSATIEPGPGPAMFASNGRSAGRIQLWIRRTVNGGSQALVHCTTIEFDVDLFSAARLIDNSGTLRLILTNEDSVTSTTRNVDGPALPTDGEWHLVGVHWDDAAGRAIFRIDDTSTLVAFTPTSATVGRADMWDAAVVFGHQVAEVQISTGLTEASSWGPLTWTPAAVVDRSQLRELSGIAAADPAEGWAILQELAAAEQGAVYLDAGGRLQYATRARLVSDAAQQPQRVLTDVAHILELGYAYALDQVRNIITAAYQPITVTSRASVWTLDEVLLIAPGQQIIVQAELSAGASHPTHAGTANSSPAGTGTEWQFSTLAVGPIVSSMTMLSPTVAELAITNVGGQTLWLVDTSGQPNVQVLADAVAQGNGVLPPTVVDDASVDEFGEQPLTLPGNRWVQRRGIAHGLAMAVAGDLAQPRPVLTDLQIPGDPRLEYFDRVTVVDALNTELVDDFWLLGAEHQVDAGGGYTTALTGRPARGRHIVGVTPEGEGLVG